MNLIRRALAVRDMLSERKRLRGPAELHYAIADRIGMLDAATWDSLVESAGFFMSRSYLLALEGVLPANIQPRYALIFDARHRPVAAVYMQLADMSVDQVRKRKETVPDACSCASLEKLAGKVNQRVLTCGNLLTYGQHGVAFVPDVPEDTLWHGVAEVLYRVRMADKLRGTTHFVMIKDVHEPFHKGASSLEKLSYRYVKTEPNMVLALDPAWRSHDDYLASLSSKYRAGIRNNILKPIDQAGCTIGVLPDIASEQDRMHELYREVQNNADFRPFELRPEYFTALQQAAGDRLLCSAIWREEKLLGFLITLGDGETAFAYHIGFDREAAAGLPVYLRLLHAGIADAIALGCRRVSFGRTALEPKAALGAKPEPFGVMLRHRQPVLNTLIKRLLLCVEQDEAPERNPFKSPAKAG